MKKHFMIDLETMGLRPTSAIVSIGITHFDKDRILDSFYTPVSLQSCLAAGMTTDPSTEKWWSEQSLEARSAWQVDTAPKLLDALTDMTKWMLSYGTHKENCPWGNGSDFDLVLLQNAFAAIDADPPWQFWNHYCFRTLKNMFDVAKMTRRGTHHNALDDATFQTQYLHRILAVHKIALP